MCPVCSKEFATFWNLVSHMRSIQGGLTGEHIEWLEGFFGVPSDRFPQKDKKIAIALERYWRKHKSWPSIERRGEEYEL
jgi:hypothetical protein